MPGRHHEKTKKVEEPRMKKMTNNKSVENISNNREAEVGVNAKTNCFQELEMACVMATTTINAIEKKKTAVEKERKIEDSCRLGRKNVYSIGRMGRRKELATELKALRQLRGEIGGNLIRILDKAQWCLSEKEFCDACGLTDKFQEIQDARALFEQQSEGDPNFYFWLIFFYGVESNKEKTKSGPLFECVMHAVKEAIMSDAKLKSKARENMLHIFNAVIA